MKISRKTVRVDHIQCVERGKKFKSRIEKLVSRISDDSIDRALTIYPIVVRTVERKATLIAGERTFLLVRARRRAEEKIPVLEVGGKDVDSAFFMATDDILGPLLFGEETDGMLDLVKPHLTSERIYRVGRDLDTAKSWQEILKPDSKRRGRKSKMKDTEPAKAAEAKSSDDGAPAASVPPDIPPIDESPSQSMNSEPGIAGNGVTKGEEQSWPHEPSPSSESPPTSGVVALTPITNSDAVESKAKRRRRPKSVPAAEMMPAVGEPPDGLPQIAMSDVPEVGTVAPGGSDEGAASHDNLLLPPVPPEVPVSSPNSGGTEAPTGAAQGSD